MRDGTVLQAGLVVSIVVPAVLCIVLVQGCEASLGSSLLHVFPRGWRNGPGSCCMVVGLPSLESFFSHFWLSRYSSVSLAVGLAKEHLSDDHLFFDLLLVSDLLHYCCAHNLLVLDTSGHFEWDFLIIYKLFS